MKKPSTSQNPEASTTDNAPEALDRREALHKLAVISAWVAPSTLMLLRSQRASAASDEEDPPAPPPVDGP
jgi:hypothetical protein